MTKEKASGGLGVKDLLTWNKSCCIKLIWLLFFQAGSIWVGWFKTEVLRRSLSNFWTIKPSTTNSWLVNKLLKPRDEVYTLIQLQVGNGESCRFWSDNWSPFGKLSQYLLSGPTSGMGIGPTTTVAELFANGTWRLPPPRSESMVQLHIFFTTLALMDEEDRYNWIVNGKLSSKYSTSEIYKELKGTEAMAPWATIVWAGRGIPRHNLLTWLFVLNRCPTRDRIASWGLQTDTACLLCNQAVESRDHLFNLCPYSWTIWVEISRRCNLQPMQNWDQTLSQLQCLQGDKTAKKLTLLCWQSTIYWVWQERNKRLTISTAQRTPLFARPLVR